MGSDSGGGGLRVGRRDGLIPVPEGGGVFGPTRDVRHALEDALDGHVHANAREQRGVMLSGGAVDSEATSRLRKRMAEAAS